MGRPRKNARREYDPTEEARPLLSRLSPDELRDKEKVWAVLAGAKIELSPQAMGKLRKQLLNGQGGTNGECKHEDIYKRVAIVQKAARACGGIEVLKDTITHIDKVKGIL